MVVLPGPPSELATVWERALATPVISEIFADAHPGEVKRLRLFEVSESQIAEFLRERDAEGLLEGLDVVTCLRDGDLEVDIHGPVGDEGAVRATQLAEAVLAEYGSKVFSQDGSSILEIVSVKLADHRLALAESCTGGMLGAKLTERPGASTHLLGGAVTYANETKRDLLGVDPELIGEFGAASPEVARAMAEGALERFRADLAVSTTGIAGPGGGSDAKPVGYVCLCALSASGQSVEREVVLGRQRDEVRRRTVTVALHMLDELLDRLAGNV